MKLAVITGFGGINAAGRSSFHHGYKRLVMDALPEAERMLTYRSLAALMGIAHDGVPSAEQQQSILDHTLIRRLEADWFDADRVPWNKRLSVKAGDTPLVFTARARDLPDTPPPNWKISDLGGGELRVEISGGTEFLIPTTLSAEVRSAGQLPTGFKPGELYMSRSHPRGLQLAIYAASDAIQSMGFGWEQIVGRVAPDQVSVYAGSAMAQLDEQSFGGMLSARANGRRVSSKQLPLGLAEMPADFVNAYVLGNLGTTGLSMGACATFLYNLRQGVMDIRNGHARVALVGASEAPLEPGVFEGYTTMGALGRDEDLLKLDADKGLSEPDYRRACRPFSSNCGFTLAEGAHFVVLMDDELALEMGASIYGSVPDVFVNADGFKKSISSPGVGNYLTMMRAVAAARAIVGDDSLRHRSFVQAHGTGTPQNRVSESHILNETAKTFGIEKWPVAAIKAYVGHSIAAAGGDQLMASLGVWRHGWIPGIQTIDHVAEDVFQSHLAIDWRHHEVGRDGMDLAILNSKGFGGNNASAVVLAPEMTLRLLQGRHGAAAMDAWRGRNAPVEESAADYERAALAGSSEVFYRFDHQVLQGEDLALSTDSVRVRGYEQPVALPVDSPYAGWLKNC